MPTVYFTSNLKRFYSNLKPTSVQVESIKELLSSIDKTYPGIADYLIEENGQLRKHVNIFIGEERVEDRINLSDKINKYDEIYIMQALSGG